MRPENAQNVPNGGPPYTIFIGNLPKYALECDLEMILQGIEYDRVRLIKTKETDEFKGFAYVDILSDESLEKALDLNDALLDENKLRVNLADGNRGGSRGGRRGGGGNNQQYPNNNNNNFQRGGYNRGGGAPRGAGGNFQRGAPQRGGFNHPRGSYYTNNHRSNSTGVHQGYDDYHNYQNFQPQRPSHQHQNRPSRFPRGYPMRARGSSRGMQRGGGGNYGAPRGGYNNTGGGNWGSNQGGRGGWNHNNSYHQYPPHQYHPNPQRSRVTSTSSRNNDPPLQPLSEEERANRPRLNLLPRSVGANNESDNKNSFVMTERNVAIFGKSITRSANSSLEPSPTTTMADPAIISATPHLPAAKSSENIAENSQLSSSSGHGSSPGSEALVTAPHSFSTPYGEEEEAKPPDANDHSDSGFRSEDGFNYEGQQSHPSPNVQHLEAGMSVLQV
ncbi:uncharacterized protein LOC142334753 isoform X2 [Convolutriloba macropyga]|uniref:uncharacterized protein LOC142334753 isoform X2 n=1 Tax=Convolutriloba macropyga TaxID=536237 RepID=UPI003F51B92F